MCKRNLQMMEWKIERKEQMYQYIETFYVQKERERWKTEMVKRDLKVVEILDIDKAAKSEARHIEGCK